MGITRSWERSVTKTSSRMQVVTLSEPAIAGPFLHSANRSRVPRAHPCQQDKHLRFVDSLSVVLLAVQGYLLHDLRLCRRTNSRHADAHIDCWTNAFVKEVGPEEQSVIGDAYARWDNGRDISFLGFDEWQSRP